MIRYAGEGYGGGNYGTPPPHESTGAYHHHSPSSPRLRSISNPRIVPVSAPPHTQSHSIQQQPPPPPISTSASNTSTSNAGYYTNQPHTSYPYYGDYASSYMGQGGWSGQQQQQQVGQQGQNQSARSVSGGSVSGQGGSTNAAAAAAAAAAAYHHSQQQQQHQQQGQQQPTSAHSVGSGSSGGGGAGAGGGGSHYGATGWPPQSAGGYAYQQYNYPHYPTTQPGGGGVGYGVGGNTNPNAYGGQGVSPDQTPSSAGWTSAWPGSAGGDASSGYRGLVPGQSYGRDAAGNPVGAYSHHQLHPQHMTGMSGHHPSALSGGGGVGGGHDFGHEYGGLGKRSEMDDQIGGSGGKKRKGGKGKGEISVLGSHVSMIPPPAPEPPVQAKSHLHPPAQARSAWQIFFADRLNEAKSKVGPGDKLNVAHVAKDAGAAYAALHGEEKEHYARRAAEAREQYAIELAKWQHTLTPEDVRIENAFRANQRKSGKSRKGNLKDPNAPKKPLSAYFLFLKAIRSSPELTKQVFEGESETTKQSMLAAKRWRSFSDDEKKPYLKQAELDKAEYDALRKQYEDDAAARARGEDVPEREHVEPSYAKETVSPRLLAAVLPRHLSEVELDDVVPREEGGEGDAGVTPGDVDVPHDEALTAELLKHMDEHEERTDQSMEPQIEGEQEVKDENGELLQSLVLPEGIDFATNFDLSAVSRNEETDHAFDYQHPTEDEEMGDNNGRIEDIKADDLAVVDASAIDAVVAAAAASAEQSTQASPLQPEDVEAPLAQEKQVEESSTIESSPVEEPNAALDVSPPPVDESPAIEDIEAKEDRSPTPEPEQAKIDAAAEMGVTTEVELAENGKFEDVAIASVELEEEVAEV